MLIFWSLEDQKFIAISPQLPGLQFLSESRRTAAELMDLAIDERVEQYQRNGWELPEPHDSRLVEAAFIALKERGLL